MTLPVLTWALTTQTTISVGAPTYADFLNAVENQINASTYWKVNNKTLDAGNSRGYIELAPKSLVAGVTEGRILILFSSGTVAGATGSERPLIACRNPPWNTATAALAVKTWVGFSPDANSSSSGPVNDPWINSTPYGATPVWSRLFPLNAATPQNLSSMQCIESSDGIALWWTGGSANDINGIISGKLLESVDGNTGYWMCSGLYTSNEAAAPSGGGWNTPPTSDTFPPIAAGYTQNNTGAAARSWAVAFKGSTLYGIGRNWAINTSTFTAQGFSGPDGAALQAVLLCGNVFTSSGDSLIGIFRQVRWGPAAYRGQKLFSGGVEQAICLNYLSSGAGVKHGGLWFDHFR